MERPAVESHLPPVVSEPIRAISGVSRVVADYFGFVLKNVIGWVLILGSLPIGLTVPVPGPAPVLFLIGFTLVTFPGKRQLVTRVMRGKEMQVGPGPFIVTATVLAVIATTIALAIVGSRYEQALSHWHLRFFDVIGFCLLAAGISLLTLWAGLALLNFLLRRTPRLRRFLRPWLRRKGINLLPPRRREVRPRHSGLPNEGDPIIALNESSRRRLNRNWEFFRPWLKRVCAVAITVWIFTRICRPIVDHWSDPDVQRRLHEIEPWRFAVAVGMFSIFLFAFRALAWRRIMRSFGFLLPVAPAVRIWSTSELARYVPGAVFQVIGRVVLTKKYGIRGSVTSVTQVLELAIFLLANVLVAVTCLLYFGIKNLEGAARQWLIIATALLPVLLLLLQPKICYGIINAVLVRLDKPIMQQRLSGQALLGILVWNIIGLVWQSMALFVLAQHALGLKLQWWWVLAGAYCLAWCAGFIAFWAPGGLGVRELVFVTAMHVALPQEVRRQFGTDNATLAVFLSFLSLLLRLWTTAGELLLAGIAYTMDINGALGRIPLEELAKRSMTPVDEPPNLPEPLAVADAARLS
ncbi:MAG: flippase-like domain-containing protein [Phycisphaerae bacterium]|nr:flippase-like domain-containing protein [Phycisphaerae bacterium]